MSFFLMNLLNDPTVKKFYQNKVMKVPIKCLKSYKDMSKVKTIYPAT